MEHILSSVKDYLSLHKTDYAIQLNGAWGSGKTHYILNELVPMLKDELILTTELETNDDTFNTSMENLNSESKPYLFIYISLNGLKNVEEIAEQIIFKHYEPTKSFIQEKAANSLFKYGSAVLQLFVAGSTEKLEQTSKEDYEDYKVKKALQKVDLNNILLCFDDLERLDPSVNVEEVLGFIMRNYIETNYVKTIFISNEDEMDKLVKFTEIKEKIIGRSLKFDRPIVDSIENFIKTIYRPKNISLIGPEHFYNFIINNIDTIKQIVTEINITNLRTFRFAMDNFKIIYSNILDKDIMSTDAWLVHNKEAILKSILLFTLIKSKLARDKNLETTDLTLLTEKSFHWNNIFNKIIKNNLISNHFSSYSSIDNLINKGYFEVDFFQNELIVSIPFKEEAEQLLINLSNYENFEISELPQLVDSINHHIKQGNYFAYRLPYIFYDFMRLAEKSYITKDLDLIKRDILNSINLSLSKQPIDKEKKRKFENKSLIDNRFKKEVHLILDKVEDKVSLSKRDKLSNEICSFIVTLLKTDKYINEDKYIQEKDFFYILNSRNDIIDILINAKNKNIKSFESFLARRYVKISQFTDLDSFSKDIEGLETFLDRTEHSLPEIIHDKLKYDLIKGLIRNTKEIIDAIPKLKG